jgi:hypothetical protein
MAGGRVELNRKRKEMAMPGTMPSRQVIPLIAYQHHGVDVYKIA